MVLTAKQSHVSDATELPPGETEMKNVSAFVNLFFHKLGRQIHLGFSVASSLVIISIVYQQLTNHHSILTSSCCRRSASWVALKAVSPGMVSRDPPPAPFAAVLRTLCKTQRRGSAQRTAQLVERLCSRYSDRYCLVSALPAVYGTTNGARSSCGECSSQKLPLRNAKLATALLIALL